MLDAAPVPIEYDLVEIYEILPRTTNLNNSNIRQLWREGVASFLEANSLKGNANLQQTKTLNLFCV